MDLPSAFYSTQKCCSFCNESGHDIRTCHCTEAMELFNVFNNVFINMHPDALKIVLQQYTLRRLKMLSVILDLRIFPKKLELIQNIIIHVIERQLMLTLFNGLHERQIPVSSKIVVNTKELNCNRKNEEYDCPICLNSQSITETFFTNCKHSFCVSCVKTHLKTDTACKCPMCRETICELELNRENVPEDIVGKREYIVSRC